MPLFNLILKQNIYFTYLIILISINSFSNTITNSTSEIVFTNCTLGEITKTQYATTNSGGYGFTGSNNNGAIGSPDGNSVNVLWDDTDPDKATILGYQDNFSGGSEVVITAKHINGSYPDGIKLQYSINGTNWTALDSTAINGFNATSFSDMSYIIPTSRTGNYKYIRIVGNSNSTYIQIDAVKITTKKCAMYQAEIFNDSGIGGGVFSNGIKDGTESATGLPTELYVNVVDISSTVVFSNKIKIDGTYSIPELADGNYNIVISSNNTAITSILPSTWKNANNGSGTYTITVVSNEVSSPISIPILAINTCEFGEIPETQYATTNSGGYGFTGSNNNGAIGSPDGNSVNVLWDDTDPDKATILGYQDNFSGGSEVVITAKHINGSYPDGIKLQYSINGTNWTALDSTIINGFNATSFSDMSYIIPTSRTGNYKYIRIVGNSNSTYIQIDAVKITTKKCAMYQAEIFNDSGIGGGVFSNGIKDGTESATGLPTELYVNVVDISSTVVFSNKIKIDGTYSIPELADGNYNIVISSNNTAITSILPSTWENANNGSGTYTITVVSNEVSSPISIPILAINTCEFGEIPETQYATTNSGGYGFTGSNNNGAIGSPDGNSVNVLWDDTDPNRATILGYQDNFSGGSEVVITAKHINGSYPDGIKLQYSINGTNWTALDSTIINGFNATSFSDMSYIIPTSRTGNYKYIRIVGNSDSTYIQIDAVKITTKKCNTCPAGIASPNVSLSNVSNICPTTTIDLSIISADNILNNTELTWHTATPATTANKVTNISTVSAGVYYAAFYNVTNDCYSGKDGDGTSTTKVIASINSDLDFDGIKDIDDIDDDNDGILDINEKGEEVTIIPIVGTNIINNGSLYGTNYDPKLNSVNPNSWFAPNTSLTHWIGVTFDSPSEIKAVSIQGRSNGTYRVTSFRIDGTKDNGSTWSDLGTYAGNTDSTSIVSINISNTDSDWTGVRIFPLAYQNWPSLRFGVTIFDVDTDRDGKIDRLDIDSDNDGIPDNIEAQSTENYIALTGLDSDNDGLDNAYDATPNGTSNGNGSLGITPINTDNLDKADYLDLDSDNDNISDIKENGDTDNVISGIDTDGDGLDDNFDTIDNSLPCSWDSNDKITLSGKTELINFFGDIDNDASNTITEDKDLNYRDSDFDNDGVKDIDDLDDDNDGILDTEESIGCSKESLDINKLSFNGNSVASQSKNSLTNSSTSGWTSSYSLKEFELPIHLEFTFKNKNVSSMFGLISVNDAQTVNNWNDKSEKFFTYTDGRVYGYFNSTTWSFNQTQNIGDTYTIDIDEQGILIAKINGVIKITYQAEISNYRLVTTTSNTASQIIENIKLIEKNAIFINCPDIDGDTYPNYLDLDSDGDNCPDAVEGDGNFTFQDLEVSTINDNTGSSDIQYNLGNTVGSSSTTKGIPTIANTGQSIGSSQDSTILSTTCIDFDQDGINDIDDLDDDNDGILDTVEGSICNTQTTLYPIDFSQITNDANASNLNYTFPSKLYLGGKYIDLTVTSNFTNNSSSDLAEGDANGNLKIGGNANNSLDLAEGDLFLIQFSKPVYVEIHSQSVGSIGNFDGGHGPTGTGDLARITTTGGFIVEDTNNELDVKQITSTAIDFRPQTNFQFSTQQGTWKIKTKEKVSNLFYRLDGNSAGTLRFLVAEKLCATLDSDNDGIINSFDLDSDNDGCPDAIEAAVPTVLQNSGVSTSDGIIDNTSEAVINVAIDTVGTNGFAASLEDLDTNTANILNAYTTTNYTTYALDSTKNGCGKAMITEVYWKDSEKIIEVTNIDSTKVIVPNGANINLFNNGVTTSRTASLANSTEISERTSILFANSSSVSAQTKSGVNITESATVIAFDSINDVIAISRNGKENTSFAWDTRIDVAQNMKKNTAYVRTDEILSPNTTFTASEWVYFVDDNINPYKDLAGGGPERHPHDPLISEITSNVHIEANILLGLHRFNSTTRTNGSWNNGHPDRSRHIEISENYTHSGSEFRTRKLSLNTDIKFSIIDNLLLINDEIHLAENNEIRLIGTSQLVQTHTGVSKVSGTGKLLVDQNSTVPSVYRYNYLSSPVNTIGTNTYTIETVLKDGTVPTNPTGIINTDIAKDITFINSYDGKTTNPISLADYWIFTYGSSSGGRSNWAQKKKNGVIPATDGFIMKGPGRAQNYTFIGTAKDGELKTSVGANESYLVGNPFSSAISAKKFIEDNINSTTGTLYFWQHAGEKGTDTDTSGHNYSGYVGGYATRNISMGLAANDPTTLTEYDIHLEAEDAIKQGVISVEQEISAVILNGIGDFVEFKDIIKGIDTLRFNYKSTSNKEITIKVNGVNKGEVTLPSVTDYTTFEMILCMETGTDIRIESNDTNLLYIDYLQLKDTDGKISCAPSTAGSNNFTAPGAYIPIAQGFFIQGDNNGGEVIFNNSQREFKTEGSESVFFRSSKKSATSLRSSSNKLPIIKLGMDYLDAQGKSIHRKIGISFNQHNSFEYEKGYDSEIYDLGVTDIYWKFPNNESTYVIAGVQEISDNLEVPFDIIMDYTGSVAIQIDEMEAIDSEIFIKDNTTDKTYLLNDKTISLQLEKGIHTNRFSLAFKENTVLSVEDTMNTITNKDIAIYMDNNSKEIVIQNYGNLLISKIELFNLLGQKIAEKDILENTIKNKLVLKKVSSNIYIVKVKTNKGIISKKILKK